jgi:hypothetical protein
LGCKGDIKSQCADVSSGEESIMTCILSHMSELGDRCKAALSNAGAGKG